MIINDKKSESICTKVTQTLDAVKPKTKSDYFLISWIVPAALAGATFFGPIGGVFAAVGATVGYYNSLDPAPKANAKKIETVATKTVATPEPKPAPKTKPKPKIQSVPQQAVSPKSTQPVATHSTPKKHASPKLPLRTTPTAPKSSPSMNVPLPPTPKPVTLTQPTASAVSDSSQVAAAPIPVETSASPKLPPQPTPTSPKLIQSINVPLSSTPAPSSKPVTLSQPTVPATSISTPQSTPTSKPAVSQLSSFSLDDKKFPEIRNPEIGGQPYCISAQQTPILPTVRSAVGKEGSLVFPSQAALFSEARPIPYRGNTCWAASITQTILPFLETPIKNQIKSLQIQIKALELLIEADVAQELRFAKNKLQTCRELLAYIDAGKNPGERQVHDFIRVFFKIVPGFYASWMHHKKIMAKNEIRNFLIATQIAITEAPKNAANQRKLEEADRSLDNLLKLDVAKSKFEVFENFAQSIEYKLSPIALRQQDADEMMVHLLAFVEGESQIREHSFGYYFNDLDQPVDREFASNPYCGKHDMGLIANRDNRIDSNVSFSALFQSSFLGEGIKDFNVGGGKKKDLQMKRDALSSAPERLIILFKRYGDGKKRIDGPVPGMDEILEVPGQGYFLDGKNATYRLDGAIIHIGESRQAGHYVAIRRHVHAGSGKITYELLNDGKILDLNKATQEDLRGIVGWGEKVPEFKTALEKYLFLASYSYIPFFNRIIH